MVTPRYTHNYEHSNMSTDPKPNKGTWDDRTPMTHVVIWPQQNKRGFMGKMRIDRELTQLGRTKDSHSQPPQAAPCVSSTF
jgi:hypothetical protein